MHDATALSVTAFKLPGKYFELECLSGGARFVGVDSGHQLWRTAMNRPLCQHYHVVINGICAIFELTAILILTSCQRGMKFAVSCWEDFACGWWWLIWKLQLAAGSCWTLGMGRNSAGRRVSVLVLKCAQSETSSSSSWVWHEVGRRLCPWCWYILRVKQKVFAIMERNSDMKSALLMGMDRSKLNRCPFFLC